MTRVSIVIPCYNQARFLEEAIASALAQTWPAPEVVVVDDGSTDGSAAVARRHAVRLVAQENRGLSAARNAGLAASTGDVLIFLDADDRLRPEAAAAAVGALEASPDAMMAFGRCALIDERGEPLAAPPQPPVTDGVYAELLRHNCIWTPAAAAFRRSVFPLAGGFDPAVNPAADYDLYLRIARRFPLAPHAAVVAEYRQHGGSMSRDAARMLTATLAVLRRQRPFARRSTAEWTAYRAGMRRWREFYGDHLVERVRSSLRCPGGAPDALRCAWQLLRLHPRRAAREVVRKLYVIAARAPRPAEKRAA